MARRPGIPDDALISPSHFHLWQEVDAGEAEQFLQPSVRFRKSSVCFNGEAKAESFSPARGPRSRQETAGDFHNVPLCSCG